MFQSTPPCRGRRPVDTGLRVVSPREGATSVIQSHWQPFQSTPPCRGRPGVARRIGDIDRRRFNPRPRVGGDEAAGFQAGCGRRLFQSTPPCRGRHQESERPEALDVVKRFQSTPPCRGRPVTRSAKAIGIAPDFCFNPRPRVGGDGPAVGRLHPCWSRRFQSTPPCRGRRRISARCSILSVRRPVSIHAPV